MKAKFLVNLALIAALVALSLLAYFKPWQKTVPEAKITQLKRDDITRIAIEPRVGATIKLERIEGAWRLVAPLKAQAESTEVDRVLDISNAKARQKLATADLSQFDLNPPQVRVTLNDQAIAFGRVNDVTYEQYLATADGVYLTPPHYGQGIPTDVGKLISRRLLDQGEIPVSFDFGRYRIERDDKGVWAASGSFVTDKDQPLSQDDFNRWADEWRFTSALSVEADKGSQSREQIKLRFNSSRTVTMQIARKEPDFQLVRADNALRYQFGAEVGRRLLDPRVVAKK